MKLSSYLRYLSGDRLRLLLNYYRRRVGGSSVLRLLRRDPISVVSLPSPSLRASFGALSALWDLLMAGAIIARWSRAL